MKSNQRNEIKFKISSQIEEKFLNQTCVFFSGDSVGREFLEIFRCLKMKKLTLYTFFFSDAKASRIQWTQVRTKDG